MNPRFMVWGTARRATKTSSFGIIGVMQMKEPAMSKLAIPTLLSSMLFVAVLLESTYIVSVEDAELLKSQDPHAVFRSENWILRAHADDEADGT